MLLQSFISSQSPLSHNLILSSTSFYSQVIPLRFRNSVVLRTNRNQKKSSTCCWVPQVQNYGTVDHERRNPPKWNALYRKISLMENPELDTSTVLNQWEKGERKLTKWELGRVVKQLRKFKRYKLALEVCDWMTTQGDRFRLSSSDIAVQLDLISKVHGILSTEEYFSRLPDTIKDRRVYGALLNAYVWAKMREKAEALIKEMRNKGYYMHPLPFNVMMTLYMNLKEYEKVDSMIMEMKERNVALDICSYNIWLTSCGTTGSMEKMEHVFERMKLDRTVNPNWTTYCTMATMYGKLGQIEKAEDCLKKVESRIRGRDRMPYHYLLSLYSSIGKKEQVYRVWNAYQSSFPNIPNLSYLAMVASLVKLDDIEGAEMIYEKWLSVRSKYDPRICNLLIGWYARKGLLEKAEGFLYQMVEVGGKPNSNTWEIFAEGHIGEKQICEALSCYKRATSAEGAKYWRPKPANVSSFLMLCELEGNMEIKEAFVEMLRQAGCLEEEPYFSLVRTDAGAIADHKRSMERAGTDRTDGDDDDDGTDMLLSELQESL